MSLTLARKGYRLLAQDGKVATGRKGNGEHLDTQTVIELGTLEESLGPLAATVYAAALLGPLGNDLARALCSNGPWSWSPDAWSSAEAYEILHNDVHALRETQTILNEIEFSE